MDEVTTVPLVYTLGAWLLRYKWFPNFISNTYFATVNKYKHKKKAFKVFDKMLKDAVLLNLDLKENIDFKWDDTDEIKVRGYRKEHLITMGYSPNYSDVNSISMDEWNMHTFPNHGITADKIKLCSINDSTRLIDIFYFALEQTEIDLKTTCPCLYEYLCSRNINYKNNTIV